MRFYCAILVIMADEHKAIDRTVLSEAAQLLTKARTLLTETNDFAKNSGSRDRPLPTLPESRHRIAYRVPLND